ncbi:MAG: ribosome biogenesis GTPase YlqF [Acholeplasmataceae bacterium]|nr:ribosome biogenesis GTPase YlqF [Acholeplasmataceae bacterium]
MNKTNINWFPGHMAKAKREIEEKLKFVDVVFELVDARIPLSSRNPMISEILKNKPHLILMTKATMADPVYNSRFEKNLIHNEALERVLLIDSISGLNTNKIVSMSKELLKEKLEKEKLKGMKERPLKAMVIGIPNVGKSTLINKLVGKKTALVGNRPGVTISQQWIRINKDLDLLDTPGVLWPKFETQEIGFNLALTGAIKDTVVYKDDMILYFLSFLKENYKDSLKLYNVTSDTDNIEILNIIGKNKNFIRNKEIEYERVYDLIINDFRNLKLGRITLDR